MATARKILIADPDLESARALSRALRQRGYQVHYAPDGSRALELSVLRHPHLVLFDEGCQLLDARTFAQILHTNPRTDQIPVLLTATRPDPDRVRVFRDGWLKKPFNLDEAVARIEQVFRRSDATRELRGEAKEIEGNLSQVSIPDVLQILAMNRRSGRLTLSRGEERGEILLHEGRPVNARAGQVDGQKGLFRLLTWTEGSFAFVPGATPAKGKVERPLEELLLEGMRQADEVGRFLPSLPPRTVRLQLSADSSLPTDLHPVTRGVLDLLREPRPLAEVVDLVPSTDLEVLAALSSLMQKGVVQIAEGEPAEGHGPLLGPAEVHALRARLFRSRAPAQLAVAKLFVCGKSSVVGKRVLRELPGVLAVGARPPALRSGFGTLGRLELSEALKLDLCMLPASEAARPLWRPFCGGAAGGLLLDLSDSALRVAAYLGWEIRVPLVVVGTEVPAALKSVPAGAACVRGSVAEGVRALLIQALNPVQPLFSARPPEPEAPSAPGR